MNPLPVALAFLAMTAAVWAQPLLDFSTSTEGFADSAEAGGTTIRTTETGGGSLRLTNPAAWTWRTVGNFNKSGTGKSQAIAVALGTSGQTGGFLHFDLILRPGTSVTGRTGAFWGVQYLVAINQSIPGGAGGWFQKIAHSLPATAFPPAAETVIPVSLPLATWSDTAAELRVHPDSPYYQIHLGTNAGGATQIEWHIDNLRLETPPTTPGSILLEAENAILTGVSVATTAPGYNGAGYVHGFDQTGDRLTWNFTATGGVHRLLIRHRAPAGMKGFSGTLNNGGFSGYFPAGSTFATYDAGLVELAAGPNTLTLGGGWNFYEIDSATLTQEAPPPPPSPGPAIPADGAATPAARALLTAIASGYGSKTWSGQHESGDLPHILSVSGKTPAIFSGDLINYSPSRTEHAGIPAGYTESLITAAEDGHPLSVIWHWNAPSGLLNTTAQPWWRGFYTEATTFDAAAALANPNSPEYALLLRDIDAIAVQLRKLEQASIPVLWRPLHEAEGGWFWWGAKGPEAFKQLWHLLFNRLTQHHGLHHLIWVLTVEDPAWYPGNEFVDIVGVDAYPDDRSDALLTRWEPLRARFDGVKPIALTEFGGVPDIEKMQRLGVWWSWFASWQGAQYGPQSSPDTLVSRIYQSTSVITRDELPPLLPDPQNLDSNNDGVSDAEALALGFPVDLDLSPATAFFRANAERFSLGHSAADLENARLSGRQEILSDPNTHDLFTSTQLRDLVIGQPVIAKDPATGHFTLDLEVMHSLNLTTWSRITPTSLDLRPDGTVELELPAAGDAAFYRILGGEP
jgi:mannan endo-1,4-beta-mannosidase